MQMLVPGAHAPIDTRTNHQRLFSFFPRSELDGKHNLLSWSDLSKYARQDSNL